MVRAQIQFTEEQLEVLRARAAQLTVSVSEVVRRAVEAWVKPGLIPSPDELRRRAREAAGRFGSGETDVARKHDQY
ncbi:MAG: hypothetical protein AMS21_05720, partial [Gemmatimonas sp. SG8_38_2]